MLNINIKASQIELTPAIRSYAEEKAHMIEKYFDARDTDPYIQIELGRTTHHHHSGDVFRAEMNLTTGRGTLRAASEKDDLYAAVDSAKDELVDVVQERKDKMKSVGRRGARMVKNIFRTFGIGE